jgi:RNA polymerase sigma-70 factor (ECF subfamily)
MVRFTDSSIIATALRDPDVQLMLRVRGGDQDAFDELHARYEERVCAVITHLMGHSRFTEDLSQEVFLRLYRARKTYEVGARFSTWLFTIVNNVVSNARRSLARRREINVTGDDASRENPLDTFGRPTEMQTPDQAAERIELQDIVQAGVQRLGTRQRQAVSLCDFDGLSYAGVAEAMGTSPDAAKSLIHRGRSSLRQMLEARVRSGALL